MLTMELRVNNNNHGESTLMSTSWSDGALKDAPSKIRPKRDFRFQVIQVRQCPKWFVWPSRNGETNKDENDENENSHDKKVDTEQQTAVTTATTQNGYGSMRRSFSRLDAANANEDSPSAPTPSRRLSVKDEKAATVPLPVLSTPASPTFKILSVAKKWESFDATEEELDCATGKLTISERHSQ